MSDVIVDPLGDNATSTLLAMLPPQLLAKALFLSMQDVDKAYREYFSIMQDSGSMDDLADRVAKLSQHHTVNATDVAAVLELLEQAKRAQDKMEQAVHKFCMVHRAMEVRKDELTKEAKDVLTRN